MRHSLPALPNTVLIHHKKPSTFNHFNVIDVACYALSPIQHASADGNNK